MAIKDVYDEETAKIHEVGVHVQRLWRDVAPTLNLADHRGTAKKLNEWVKVAEGAFERIGFRARVDVNPIYGDQPPGITIVDRVNPIDEFDHEKKEREVRQAREQGRV